MEVYTVSYADVEQNRGMPVADDVLANAVDHLKLDMPDATVVREQPLRVQNYPAREVVLTRADGDSYICRIVLAGARVYVVGVGGPWVKPEGSDRTRRFFESFKVTNPPAAAPGIGRPNGNRPPRRKMPQPEED
jgi:hypothetical protein